MSICPFHPISQTPLLSPNPNLETTPPPWCLTSIHPLYMGINHPFSQNTEIFNIWVLCKGSTETPRPSCFHLQHFTPFSHPLVLKCNYYSGGTRHFHDQGCWPSNWPLVSYHPSISFCCLILESDSCDTVKQKTFVSIELYVNPNVSFISYI